MRLFQGEKRREEGYHVLQQLPIRSIGSQTNHGGSKEPLVLSSLWLDTKCDGQGMSAESGPQATLCLDHVFNVPGLLLVLNM